ncbi:AAA family ATPase [Sphingomonas lenta]|uniref:ATPase n=1 Tax=Sphingomonas lenta TaxID=1141887 RepID=A0A2A2SCI0_9SPHN|nr:AAA family ATPase [Sphingomonas lenta]PAX06900.1 ATPase [Sphingomonas lenta]
MISGCSGGGKSTLLRELASRGHAVVEEPGRRIVADELAQGGSALPWTDLTAFARRAMASALEDHAAAEALPGPVFFDRGLVDAAVALAHASGRPIDEELLRQHRYDPLVFLALPWPDIYVTDAERRHGFDEAIDEYERLARAFPILGYRAVTLPRCSAVHRADFVLDAMTPD